MSDEKSGKTGGLWRKIGICGCGYLVKRRDGTVPEWPSFVLGAKDPAAPSALRHDASEAETIDVQGDARSFSKDVSDKPRTFRVFLNKNIPGAKSISEIVVVPAGEDASQICKDCLDTMISNEIESGWQEISEGDVDD